MVSGQFVSHCTIDALARAAALLKDGHLVAFPTETVYGLGAHALDRDAVRRIFDAKGRPSTDPLIVHVLDASRAVPDDPSLKGAMALNVSSPSSDVGMMFRYFAAANFSPTGSNFEQWKDDKFEDALKTLSEATVQANHEMELSFQTEDFKEGVAHFLEKRAARFSGK